MNGRTMNIRFGGPITPIVKKLMFVNIGVFLLQLLFGLSSKGLLESIFGLSHTGIFQNFMLWQPFTYMFLHGGFLHIFFNLFALWMFAGELEQEWGSKTFLQYYIYSGIGAGIFILLMNIFVYSHYQGAAPITIGASGALYAILLAYGLTWPNREVLLYFLFPVKMKYLVIIFGAFEFFGSISSAQGRGSNVSHIAHIGGLISGFMYLTFRIKRTAAAQKTGSGKDGIIGQQLKKSRLKKQQERIKTRIKAKAVIDSLLEKIARDGMGALSTQEKRDLEWARKHYYPDDNTTMH